MTSLTELRKALIRYLLVAVPKLSKANINYLLAAYNEQWRTYHNLYHIFWMIISAEKHFKSSLTDEEWRVLLTMILYHDVVYKVGEASKENERASADLMADHLIESNEPKWFEGYVWAGIYATKTHSLEGVPEQYRKVTALLIDLDLEGLGLSAEGFAKNTETIWYEYQPIASRQQYDRGREGWARSFLNRSHIFQTELFRDMYAAQARSNLERLLGK